MVSVRLTKNFNLREFFHSDTAFALNIDNTTDNKVVLGAIRKLVVNVLQPLRDAYGYPLHINSGYRCAALNKAVNGAPTSQHCKGEAADVSCPSPIGLARIAKELNLPYDQMIIYPTFVHFSHKQFGEQRRQILYSKTYKGKRL